jgi:hypothetical protein
MRTQTSPREGSQDSTTLRLEDTTEPVHRLGLRQLLLRPQERGVVERKVVPFEVAGVIQDGAYLLDGGNRWEHELLTHGGVKEVELGAGVGSDESAMGQPDDAALGEGRVRERDDVCALVGEAVELGGACRWRRWSREGTGFVAASRGRGARGIWLWCATAAEQNRSRNSSSGWMTLRMTAGRSDQSTTRAGGSTIGGDGDSVLETGGNWKVIRTSSAMAHRRIMYVDIGGGR